jgi:glucose/arabinose dehydrogenase
MLVTAPAGDPKLYVVGQRGQIRIIDENDVLLPDPFLDIDTDDFDLSTGGEAGLLGLAFHPQYHVNRTFFIYYTKTKSSGQGFPLQDVVARCQRDPNNPNLALPTCTEILAIRDPAGNHNGGMIEFGPDGHLYIGTGDGGPQNDPAGSAQALEDGPIVANGPLPPTALLGKILRIDVDHPASGKQYGIPSDNPFASGGGAPEIFARGLRNPWRWSFDSATGDMWIGDVGQSAPDPREEITFVKAGQLRGANFGWRNYEGLNCRNPPCDPAGQTFPIEERVRTESPSFVAIIGGQVYRGTCYPDLVGTYFYSDNGAGGLYTGKFDSSGTYTRQNLPAPQGGFPSSPASIHASASGELYLTTTGGAVFHIEAGP